MEIIKIKIENIKPYKNNAKLHPQEQIEQIKKSILEFGNNDPIAIDENNIIIEGHGRYEALKQLDYKEVDCIRLSHLSEEQKKAYILVHNKLTMNTGFDINILNEELESIENINMEDFDFNLDISYIDDLFDEGVGEKTSQQETFDISFNFDIEYKEKIESYIRENGKGEIVKLILEEVENA